MRLGRRSLPVTRPKDPLVGSAVGTAPIRMVEDVEHLETELQKLALNYGKFLRNAPSTFQKPGIAKEVAGLLAERSGGGLRRMRPC